MLLGFIHDMPSPMKISHGPLAVVQWWSFLQPWSVRSHKSRGPSIVYSFEFTQCSPASSQLLGPGNKSGMDCHWQESTVWKTKCSIQPICTECHAHPHLCPDGMAFVTRSGISKGIDYWECMSNPVCHAWCNSIATMPGLLVFAVDHP